MYINTIVIIYIYIYIYISISISIYIYIISEVERKWVPIIKEVLTNKISGYLKFIHISL